MEDVLIIVIEDNPIFQYSFWRMFGRSKFLYIPKCVADIENLPTENVGLIICDRMMPIEWEEARNRYLDRVPNAKVVEWTCSAEFDRKPEITRSCRVFGKSEDGLREKLEALLKEETKITT